MSDALVEKVARAICNTDFELPHFDPDFYAYARAAIAVALEEAVATAKTYRHPPMALYSIQEGIAAAIHAMVSK